MTIMWCPNALNDLQRRYDYILRKGEIILGDRSILSSSLSREIPFDTLHHQTFNE